MPIRFAAFWRWASIYDGKSRSEAARIGGVTLQVVRDWVLRFNTQGPAGLIDRKAPGNKPLLNPVQRAALAAVVRAGPNPAIDGVVRWRLADLAQWVWETFRISISRQTLGSELRELGFRKLSARPRHHEQADGAIEDFKKKFPEALAAIAEAKAIDLAKIEIWFGDEARVGQKTKLTRRWAPRGSRPSAPTDQRTVSAYIFGAICPAQGTAAGLVMPKCNTEAMKPPFGRNLAQRRAGTPRSAAARSGWMAHRKNIWWCQPIYPS